jgi:multidrug efflux pump subunit AcrB
VQKAFGQRLKALKLPPNIVVRPRPMGQQDLMGQTLAGLGGSLILSVVLVFLLMVALYNSYRSPLIILFSVPVAAVGALGALWLTHSTLNLFSLIGTILLVGIVSKNGILLVDYANTLRERGESKLRAIQESAFTRFRPIVMTSISVVAGNVPLALALEPGSSVRSSLGVVVIGGILSSLLLTLLLVPIMYVILAPEHFHGSHHIGDAPEESADEIHPDGRGIVDRRPTPVPSTV